MPNVVVLQSIADILADGPRPADIGRWLHRPGLTFVGLGFCCEAWVTLGYQGDRYGDLNTVPAMADAEVRILVAVDIDERLYQVRRPRGDTPRSRSPWTVTRRRGPGRRTFPTLCAVWSPPCADTSPADLPAAEA